MNRSPAVLGALGAERAWLVHGSDGLDEITTTGPTDVVAWENGAIRRFTIDPEAIGVTRVTLAELKGGDAAHNAAALVGVLGGARKRLSRHRLPQRRRRPCRGRPRARSAVRPPSCL